MKQIDDNYTISKSLEEVWKWKDKTATEAQGKSLPDLMELYKKTLEDSYKLINAKLLINPDGTVRME